MQSLGRAHQFPRRAPHLARHQHCRARHSPDCPRMQERAVRGRDEGAENWACTADPRAYFADVLTRLVNLWPGFAARRAHAVGRDVPITLTQTGSQKRIWRCQLCAAIRARDGSNSGLRDTLRNRSAIGGQAEVICSRRAFPILTRTGPSRLVPGCRLPWMPADAVGPIRYPSG